MSKPDLLGVFFILILVYLLVNNSTKSSAVIQALSGGVTSITEALQGRGTSPSLTSSISPTLLQV